MTTNPTPLPPSENIAIYRENLDYFIVSYFDESDAEKEAYALRVLHVIQNDHNHGIQYKAGDDFTVSVTKTDPSALRYKEWTLEPICRPSFNQRQEDKTKAYYEENEAAPGGRSVECVWAGANPFTGAQVLDLLRENERLRNDVGTIPAGVHLDEIKPRGNGTWLGERACWKSEVDRLRAELDRLKFTGAESATLAELQAERQSNAGLRAELDGIKAQIARAKEIDDRNTRKMWTHDEMLRKAGYKVTLSNELSPAQAAYYAMMRETLEKTERELCEARKELIELKARAITIPRARFIVTRFPGSTEQPGYGEGYNDAIFDVIAKLSEQEIECE
jgi:hypothetical protein